MWGKVCVPLEITIRGIKKTIVWVLILPKRFQLRDLGWVMYRFLRFWGRDRSPWIFHCAGSTSLTPALFKGQLYFPFHLCMIRQSRLTPPIVTPVDLLHKASLSTCWSYLNLSAQNYPHLLDQAASTGPLALRTGQRVALGTPFSHRIRGWGVCANTDRKSVV